SSAGAKAANNSTSWNGSARLDREVRPYRHVVGWLFPGTHVTVDAGSRQPICRLRRQQQVIDADAVVLLPSAGLIIPERVESWCVAGRAHGIGQSDVEE